MNRWFTCCGLFVAITLTAGLALAQGPAVSAPNGKIEALGGSLDGDSTKALAGSLSVPMGDLVGVQIDGAYGELDNDDKLIGIGLHLFVRDPSQYLLGLNVIHVELEDTEMRRYALEGEYYMGPFSLTAMLGQQEGDVDDAGFGSLDLRWYPLDDLMLEVGGSIADSDEMLHLGAEYQALAGLSVFADLATGDDDYDHVLVGARYYFGTQKPLIRRHREDDPANNLVTKLLLGLDNSPGASRPVLPPETEEMDEYPQ